MTPTHPGLQPTRIRHGRAANRSDSPVRLATACAALFLAGWAWAVAPPAFDWAATFTRTWGGDEHRLASCTDPSGTTYVIYEENAAELRLAVLSRAGAVIRDVALNDAGGDITTMAVDASGNVIAGGTKANTSLGRDEAFIAKYDWLGSYQWAVTYDTNYSNTVTDVTTDPAGNIVLVGYYDKVGDWDGFIVKYDGGGSFTWGKAISYSSSFDQLYAVATDASGTVYFAGTFHDDTWGRRDTLLGRRDPAGNPILVCTYDALVGSEYPRAMAYVPASDSIYLGIDNGSTIGVARISASAFGDIIDGGLRNSADDCVVGGIAVDSAGNAYLCGWTSVDNNTSHTNLLCVRFNYLNPDFLSVWSDTYDSGGMDGYGYPMPRVRIGIDPSDSVYISANVTPVQCDYAAQNLFVRKYAGGVPKWSWVRDGPPAAAAVGAATDGVGGAYLGGVLAVDPVLVKYDRTGAPVWTRYPAYGGYCPRDSHGITSAGGCIYVAGEVYDSWSLASEAGVAKYDASGTQVATYIFADIPNATDGPVAVDGSGQVYLAGRFPGATPAEDDLYVAKFSAAGTVLWSRTMSLAADDLPSGIAVDGTGAVYVLHETPADGKANDAIGLVKLDSGGYTQWTRTLTPSAALDCSGGGVLVAGSDLWVAGSETDPGPGEGWGRIYKLDSSGNVVWTRTCNGGQDAGFAGLVVSSTGNPVVTGRTGSFSKADCDVLAVSWDQAGNERWAVPYDSGSAGDYGAGVAAGSLYVAAGDGSNLRLIRYSEPLLAVSLAAVPGLAKPGDRVDVVLTATNTGGADANGVTPFIQVNAGGALVLLDVSPPGPVTIPSGSSQSFTWTYSVVGSGTVEFTATAVGTESVWGKAVEAAATAVILPIKLVGAVAADPNPAVVGDWMNVVLTVTNVGSADITAVMPSLDVNAGAGLVVAAGGPVPAGPVTLSGGGTQSFVWTFSVSGLGVVAFTATAAGTDSSTLAAVDAAGQVSVATSRRAGFAGAVSCPAAGAVVGQWVTVALTITNTGTLAATAVAPALQLNAGASLLVAKTGPEPPNLALLAGGGATTFSWTYSVTGGGVVAFTVTAMGADGASGIAVVSLDGGFTAITAARLEAALAVSPPRTTAGQTLAVALTVTNTGEVDASGVVPVPLAVGPGATIASFVTGPVPPGPVTVAAGASRTFVWTYVTSAEGPVTFTGTVTGTDAVLSTALAASAVGSATVVSPASIQAIVSATTPSVCQGQTIAITMTVSNTGATAVWSVSASGAAGPAPGPAVSWISGPAGPSPAELASLSPHGSVTFTWEYQAVGTGAVTFTATASATDSVSGLPVPAHGTSGMVTVLSVGQLAASASASPAQAGTGTTFQVRLTATNTGGAAVTGIVPSLTLSDSSLADIAGGPVPAAGGTVPGGGATTWVWTLAARYAGTLTAAARVDGTDAGLGGAATASASVSVAVNQSITNEIAIYPNPLRAGMLSIYLKLNGDAREVTVDVYDAAMHRVYAGFWRSLPRLRATLEVAGAARWAPGFYYVRARAALTDGTTQEFPVAKLVVKP